MMPAIVAATLAWLIGVLCVGAFWPRKRSCRPDLFLILSLGLGVGLGATSGLFFAASLVSSNPLLVALALEAGGGAGLGWMWWRRRGPRAAAPGSPAPANFWLVAILGSIFAQACIVSLVVAVRAYEAEPLSNSDGWTIWNMQARFLFRGGDDWPRVLQAPQILWTHPDYPLLVPASVARGWAFVGRDVPFVAGLVSTLLAVATVGLLVSAVARLRGAAVALAGGLVLLGTPFFLTFASNQHADIPLSFYILATLVLMAVRARRTMDSPRSPGLDLLAGAAAGMAAWTKNEGILFVVVAGGVWICHEAIWGSRRALGAFLGGLVVTLLPVLYFKIALAPVNDIVASAPWSRWQSMWDGARHRLILASLWRDLGRFGEWSIAPFLVMLLPLLGRGWRRLGRREWSVGLMVGLMLLGFYGVYLLTHWDLASHLDSSLVRLLLQLWPAAIFFWCLAVTFDAPVASDAADRPGLKKWRLPVVVLLNLGVATGVAGILGSQPAYNQLGRARIDDADVRVLMGEGWFGRENHGNDVWAWSKGEGVLLLRCDARQPKTVTLRFSVRVHGARTVTATWGDRVVWRAFVSDDAGPVEIANVRLESGTAAIVFHTDAPGVPESTNPGARALTFALFNPQVKK